MIVKIFFKLCKKLYLMYMFLVKRKFLYILYIFIKNIASQSKYSLRFAPSQRLSKYGLNYDLSIFEFMHEI